MQSHGLVDNLHLMWAEVKDSSEWSPRSTHSGQARGLSYVGGRHGRGYFFRPTTRSFTLSATKVFSPWVAKRILTRLSAPKPVRSVTVPRPYSSCWTRAPMVRPVCGVSGIVGRSSLALAGGR